MSFDFLKENLSAINQQIAKACAASQRISTPVKLLPVTKFQPLEKLQALYDLGLRSFGENRLQELVDKAQKLPKDIEWHLIGTLQSNKVRQAVQFAKYIHSVDSLKLIERIERIAGEEKTKPFIFLQVNMTDEPQKGGLNPEEVDAAVKLALNCQNLKLLGLMTIGKADASDEETKLIFRKLANLQKKYPALTELSMGMSADFPLAIPEGATYIRIGSLLLGERGNADNFF